jgi:hypothetical protein
MLSIQGSGSGADSSSHCDNVCMSVSAFGTSEWTAIEGLTFINKGQQQVCNSYHRHFAPTHFPVCHGQNWVCYMA